MGPTGGAWQEKSSLDWAAYKEEHGVDQQLAEAKASR
jgi:hypothetical protein